MFLETFCNTVQDDKQSHVLKGRLQSGRVGIHFRIVRPRIKMPLRTFNSRTVSIRLTNKRRSSLLIPSSGSRIWYYIWIISSLTILVVYNNSEMPFLGQDWRSPGQSWVKTEDGWKKSTQDEKNNNVSELKRSVKLLRWWTHVTCRLWPKSHMKPN